MQTLEKKTDVSLLPKVFINSAMALISLFCIVPIAYILSISLSNERMVAEFGYSIIPRGITTFAYKFILKSPETILNSYAVSAFVTIVGATISLLITTMLAYVITRKDFVLHKQISFMVFFTMLFNGGLVPTYILITQYYGLKDSILALILPYIIMPWHVFLMKGLLGDISQSLIEAAVIDGAGEVRIFFGIILPISKPALATVGLFSAFVYWNDWWLALLYINKQTLWPLQKLLSSIMQNLEFISNNVGSGISIDYSNMPSESARMAMCVLAVGPMMCVFPFFQKYFISGLTAGAVKE